MFFLEKPMDPSTLIVISHYAIRQKVSLENLLSQARAVGVDIVLVINDDNVHEDQIYVEDGIKYIKRQNVGMNIAAWWCAYSKFSNYENYIFFQDECVIINNNFVSAYISKLSQSNVGLVGESINYKWDRPWLEIANSGLNYQIQINNSPISRVNFYLLMLRHWNINPGSSGKHMRALVWAFKRSTLEKIGAFPMGINKDECIAAEIAVSKKIEEIGLLVEQAGPLPFLYVKHLEWRSDGMSKLPQ